MDHPNQTEQTRHRYAFLAGTLGTLKPFFEDPAVVEIMCNGGTDVWVESSGKITLHRNVISGDAVKSSILMLANAADRAALAGTATGIIDAEIPLEIFAESARDTMANMRVAAVMAPTALRGHALCIRKHSPVVYTLDDYLANGAFTPVKRHKVGAARTLPMAIEVLAQGGPALRDFFTWMVENKKTCLISGATGSGKTTVFKALLGKLPIDERVITFEDTPELVVPSPNYVSLRSNALQGVTPQVLVKLAMRMRPDRIFAGELRDGTALDWLDACNTGHPGSIATLHANDAINALLRLESLALMAHGAPPLASVRQRILSTIDFVVHIGKDGQPGMVEEVVEVLKQDDHVGLGYHTNTRALYQRFLVH